MTIGSQTPVKWDRSFYPPFVFCSVRSPSHTLYVALTWRSTANPNETALSLSAAQIRRPKKFNGNGITSGGLTWQYIVNCRFFWLTVLFFFQRCSRFMAFIFCLSFSILREVLLPFLLSDSLLMMQGHSVYVASKNKCRHFGAPFLGKEDPEFLW